MPDTLCEACGGRGWRVVYLACFDGNLYGVEWCDSCRCFPDDWQAALKVPVVCDEQQCPSGHEHPVVRPRRIREWVSGPFRLVIFGRPRTHRGREYHAYELWDNGVLILWGDDYGPSPMHRWSSDESVGGLLGFLSCGPGDVDEDYFKGYTPQQLEWARTRAEALRNAIPEEWL